MQFYLYSRKGTILFHLQSSLNYEVNFGEFILFFSNARWREDGCFLDALWIQLAPQGRRPYFFIAKHRTIVNFGEKPHCDLLMLHGSFRCINLEITTCYSVWFRATSAKVNRTGSFRCINLEISTCYSAWIRRHAATSSRMHSLTSDLPKTFELSTHNKTSPDFEFGKL